MDISLEGGMLLGMIPLTQFCFAYLCGVWMGQPSPVRLSMGLELALRDVPLANVRSSYAITAKTHPCSNRVKSTPTVAL